MRAVSLSVALAALLLAGIGLAATAPVQEPASQEPAPPSEEAVLEELEEAETTEECAATDEADSPARQYDQDPAAQKRGSDLFRAVCTGYCHSTSVEVDTDSPYLFDCRWDHGGSDAEIFEVLTQGVPDTRMQGFGGKLPDADLWRIVSWVRMRSECPEAGAQAGEGR
ncbi:MAG TPA: cytochrome c [Thermoanaerobaculia bacterium]|nr:cytochrome c [Thermoanaerobaculia bacterium]